MKISKIIEKNLFYDSRKLKKNDIFFDFISNKKIVNPYLKNNRLELLQILCTTFNSFVDFSKLEGT